LQVQTPASDNWLRKSAKNLLPASAGKKSTRLAFSAHLNPRLLDAAVQMEKDPVEGRTHVADGP
jgi:hypothetical protein